MKIRQKIAGVSVLALAFAMAGPAFAEDAPDIEFDMYLGTGVTAYAVRDLNPGGVQKDACLAEIIKWRQDALDDNVMWPEADSMTTMREYLNDNGITEADYLNPTWSYDLEEIAIERIVETAVHGRLEHSRTNDASIQLANGEVDQLLMETIAWGINGCGAAVNLYAEMEKPHWVNNDGEEPGHYKAMINPELEAYAAAGVARAPYKDYETTAWTVIGTRQDVTKTEETGIVGPHTVPVKITDADAAKGADLDHASVAAGESVSVTANAKAFDGRVFFRGAWTSSDESVATVTDDGTVTGVSGGTVTLTLTVPEGHSMDFPFEVTEVTVVSAHHPDGVVTEEGVAPVLAETTKVHWSDGQESFESVTWDAIDPDQYAAPGSFTVNGMVKGLQVSQEVTVVAKAPATPPAQQPDPPADQPAPPAKKPGGDPAPAPEHPAKPPAAHQPGQHYGSGKGGLAHTGADVGLLGLLSILAIGTGGAFVYRYRRG